MQKRTGCTQKDVCQSSLPIFSAFGHPLPYSKSSYSQERENVMRELYKMMQGKHTSCPSWEYFCYLSRSEKIERRERGSNGRDNSPHPLPKFQFRHPPRKRKIKIFGKRQDTVQGMSVKTIG